VRCLQGPCRHKVQGVAEDDKSADHMDKIEAGVQDVVTQIAANAANGGITTTSIVTFKEKGRERGGFD
jgi:hypothetical protein